MKIKLWFSMFLLVFSIFIVTYAVNSQQPPLKQVQSEIVTKAKSKQELTREVLSEIGIAQQYDMYLGNSVDIAVSPTTKKPKFYTWLQDVLAQKAGYKYAEDKYIKRLETLFSESELNELLNLSKHPLMKKLLQAEIQAYADASEQRRQLLFQVWEDYNLGTIDVPLGVIQESVN